jgi:hypothetical protein
MKVRRKTKESTGFRKKWCHSNITHTKARGKIMARSHYTNSLHVPPLLLSIHLTPHKVPPLWRIQSWSRLQTSCPLPFTPVDPTMRHVALLRTRGWLRHQAPLLNHEYYNSQHGYL